MALSFFALSMAHAVELVSIESLLTEMVDRSIGKGTGAVNLYRMSDRQKLASVPVESEAVTILEGKTVRIKFPVVLEAKTSYSIIVDKGAFFDGENMKFLGMPVLGEWRFTTRSQP
jgi:hypothetical protein